MKNTITITLGDAEITLELLRIIEHEGSMYVIVADSEHLDAMRCAEDEGELMLTPVDDNMLSTLLRIAGI